MLILEPFEICLFAETCDYRIVSMMDTAPLICEGINLHRTNQFKCELLEVNTMPETTKNYHRVPATRKVKGNPLRTITLGKGIQALYDVKRKVIVTYIFDRKKYTMKQAKEWVNKHKQNASFLQAAHNQSMLQTINEFYETSKEAVFENLSK